MWVKGDKRLGGRAATTRPASRLLNGELNALHFFLAATTEDTVEESNSDVPELVDLIGEEFEVDYSDSEDEELEFVDSFL